MKRVNANNVQHSKRGTTLVELVVSLTLTALFAIICVALINPIERIYKETEKLSRAQLLADTIVDSIRKECDDVKNDDDGSVWIAKSKSDTFDDNDYDNVLFGGPGVYVKKATGEEEGQILVIKKNNSYCEAIYACLPIDSQNKADAHANSLESTYSGHAVDKLFENNGANAKAGIVHFGYYQAKDDGNGVYPLKSYDYTNPVMAATYEEFYVELKFSNLTYRTEDRFGTGTANTFPSFVMCTIEVYDNLTDNLIYSRTAALCFSANGSAPGSSYQRPDPEKRDVNVIVIWDDDDNKQNKRPEQVEIILNYGSKTSSCQISTNPNPNSIKFLDIDSSSYTVSQKTLDGKDTVEGYDAPYIVWNSDRTEVVITNTSRLNSVKLISGPSFKKLLNSSITGIVFCSSDEALENGWIHSSDSYTLVSIPSTATDDKNRTEDYKLYKNGTMVYVTSSDGAFVANEDCSQMFEDCSAIECFTGLERINTSRTVKMNKMFKNCKGLIMPYFSFDGWDTSHVENMDSMFCNVSVNAPETLDVTIDVSSFDFQSVKNTYKTDKNYYDGINKMFYADTGSSRITTIIFSANPDDPAGFGNQINMSKLEKLDAVFSGCKNLTNLQGFSNVNFENLKLMQNVFAYCDSLTELKLTGWNCPSIESLDFYTEADKKTYYMFKGLNNLDTLDMSGFKINNCTSVTHMFSSAKKFPRVLKLNNWGIQGITSMENFFQNKTSLQQIELNNCETQNITTIKNMFQGCTNLTSIEIDGFVKYNCTNIESAFENCKNVQTLEIDGWNTINVKNMAKAFKSCGASSISIEDFEFNTVTNMTEMFNGSGVKVITFPGNGGQPLSFTHVNQIDGMFQNCKSLTTINGLKNASFPLVTDASSMFGGCESLKNADFDLKLPIATTVANMFSNCKSLTSVDLDLDFPLVENISGLFNGCTNLSTADLKLKFNKVTEANGIFSGCTSLSTVKLDVELPNATSVKNLFSGCSTLETVDLTLNVPSATDVGYLFSGCSNLKTINNLVLNIPSATNIDNLFNGCSSLTELSLDLSLEHVTSANNLFNGCSKLATINLKLDFPNATSVTNMFKGCTGLTTLTAELDLPSVTSMNKFFDNLTSLTTVDLSNSNLSGLSTSSYMFNTCSVLTHITMNNIDLSGCTTTGSTFNNCNAITHITMKNADVSKSDSAAFIAKNTVEYVDISGTDFSSVVSLEKMFNKSDPKLVEFIATGAKFDACETTYRMFYNSYNLITVDFSNVTMDGCKYTNEMFCNCYKLYKINMKNFVTKNNTTCASMFKYCYSARDCNFSGWDTSSVTSMEAMFFNFCYCDNNYCKSKEKATIDISSFDFGKVQSLYQFFQCDKPENGKEDCIERVLFPSASNGGDPVAAKVQNMSNMFRFRKHLLYIDNLGELTATAATLNNIQYMFSNAGVYELDISGINLDGYKYTGKNWFDTCENLTTIYVAPGTDWSQVQFSETTNMFNGSTNLVGKDITGTYPDFAYTSSSVKKEYARINGLDGKNGYFTAKSA